MIFQTRDEWEVSDPIYSQLTGCIGIHRYPIVKVSLNVNLFHLEVRKHFEEEDIQIWERYIFAFIQDIVHLLSVKEFEKIKISLQSACNLDSGNNYEIYTITEIVETETNGQKAYFYKCNNGKTYFDSFNSEYDQLSSEQKIIYADYT